MGQGSRAEFSDASPLFNGEGHAGAWWMLSLSSPHAGDASTGRAAINASTTRAGWTDSVAGFREEKQVRMIEEGSVLMAPALRGRAVDVAPKAFRIRMARRIRARRARANEVEV